MALSNSSPLTPGMRISEITTSGRCRSSSSTISFAESKLFTAMSAWVRAFSSTQRMERSSSMTHTMSCLAMAVLQRKVNAEHGMPRTAAALDQAAMLGDDVLRDGQSQSGSAGLGRDHRVENMFLDFLGNARAVVLDVGAQHQAVAFLPDGETALDVRPQADYPFVLNRLRRIAHDVEYRLNELLGFALEFRKARVVVALKSEPDRHLHQHQLAHVLQDFVDIDRPLLQRLMRSHHAVHEITQAVGLVDDDAGVLLEGFVRQFAFQQLRRAAQTPERVLDFVRQTAHHRAVSRLALQHAFIARQTQQPVHLRE